MASFFAVSCSFEMACRSWSSGVPAGITILSPCALARAAASKKLKETTTSTPNPALRFIGHLRPEAKTDVQFQPQANASAECAWKQASA
jgi:hypothetical protein